jgi:C4-dicarboxylate-specific signal transduction histidine kinase
MEQVFRNILENAIHACGETGVITIHSSITEWQGESAGRIAVQDDGVGLTPEIAQQVFEPFFTTKQKGTGLGMAIVNRIMTAHAGFVSAGILTPRAQRLCSLFHFGCRLGMRFALKAACVPVPEVVQKKRAG